MTLNAREMLINFDPLTVNPLVLRATLEAMLENFGSTDTELRERLIFPTFTKLIKEGFLTSEELSRTLTICLDDNHLFFGIEKESDAVFVRADSSSIISSLLEYNSAQTFLSLAELDEAIARILLYLMREEDGRSYVEGRGWAHAVANGLDILAVLALNPDVPVQRFPEFLTVIESCIFKKVAYFHHEGERAAAAVRAMMDRGMSLDALTAWMQQMATRLTESFAASGFNYKFQCNNVNLLNFLKSLYFNFKKDGARLKLRVEVYNCIKSLQTI